MAPHFPFSSIAPTTNRSFFKEVLGYNIYRDGKKIATVSATTLSYQDHNRQPGVSYLYAVTAFDTKGESFPATVTVP